MGQARRLLGPQVGARQSINVSLASTDLRAEKPPRRRPSSWVSLELEPLHVLKRQDLVLGVADVQAMHPG